MGDPIITINEWLTKEKELGSSDPNRMVLATAGKDNVPHSRIVAVREINERGVLFFTQRGNGKVIQILENPQVSMTLWLPLQQRQVNLEGQNLPLSEKENQAYWQSLSRERQLRFAAYAPTSTQAISSLQELENKYQNLIKEFADQAHPIPMSAYYCGFRLVPQEIYFYTLGINAFSEYIQYRWGDNSWVRQLLSP